LVRRSTLLRMREKGVPRSRAKDHVILEAVVVIPIAQAQVSASTTATIAVAPATLPTLSWKTWMKGKPVFVPRTVSKSPMQKRTVSIIAKPRRPLKIMLPQMARGMLIAAFETADSQYQRLYVSRDLLQKAEKLGIYVLSSAMWTLASAPTKVATFPRNPTQYESPCVGHPPSFRLVAKTDDGLP
jgi:hypothetical protein